MYCKVNEVSRWVCRFEAVLRDSSEHGSWQHEAVAADLAVHAKAVHTWAPCTKVVN